MMARQPVQLEDLRAHGQNTPNQAGEGPHGGTGTSAERRSNMGKAGTLRIALVVFKITFIY